MKRLDVEHAIQIARKPEAVFDALIDPAQIPHYFPVETATVEPREGGEVTLQGRTDDGPFTDHGVIEIITRPSQFRYRYWSTNHGTERRPENHMVIDYRLTASTDGTHVAVRHENLLTEERQQLMDAVWGVLLNGLKTYVESSGRQA